ncbi:MULTISPECIES: hypothetical protein [Bacillus]|uniref:Uncharacterized protein n=1 Tax=Bacillus thuringiensis T01-328 TaxID=1324966 RepID=A0AAN4HJR4_BACTU|nr:MULTISPECIES: hypothetical protein [Bacillus]MEC0048457.1 hypothetical protein [Bacillus cereus]AFV21924.1 hypothetical protein BTB_502p06190 [Bacillus thuringiensis Bt407]EEM25053.1 hypothetical protein bthur0002_56950 [Bacillus thuringiensis Bt407]ERI00898.1 hypothetical protein BTCBT_002453 [Bacillus thuringiensis T01-328]MEC2682404.1 hypothetical protein [Bacillus thuringiensis]
MTYEVIHYCHVLPTFHTVESGLTLKDAQDKVKELATKQKYSKHTMDCCKFYVQPEIK